ncbi:MAG: carbohydrate-binding domain-containing protein [Bacteroidales bacterium]|nr:carbohydrate-binding domain-containing protein [Bacteroidales bacterium]
MQKYVFMILSFLILSFQSCEKNYIKKDDETDNTNQNGSVFEGINEDEDDYVWDVANAKQITLNGSYITADTGGINVNGTMVTITAAGIYNVAGTLDNGQIIVNTEDDDDIKIILNDVSITCSSSSPIYISKAKKVIIILADGSDNYITDGVTYTNVVDGEPNAAVFSKSDLTLFGDGSLTIKGNFNDGITSKDGLIIGNGKFSVTSADDGIRGKDYILVHDGDLTVNSGGDGLKSDNDADASAGFIIIDTGNFVITSAGDAISACTDVVVTNGDVIITSGGGSSRSTTLSAKGIKALVSLAIEGGNININSADDGLHSHSIVDISGGLLDISSNDDGIHAETSVTIANSNVSITKSYEAIESKTITVENSTVNLVATNDGINATAGTTAGGTESNDGSKLYLKSGFIVASVTNGDCIDSNGDLVISGGTILAHGPNSSPELGFDVNGSLTINGGIVAVSGPGSQMLETPSTSSLQYSVVIIFSSLQSANSITHIQDSDGNEIITFAPIRNYQTLHVSSPDFKNGETYTIYTGGSYSVDDVDGLFKDGTYNAGTIYQTFTISSIVTTIGTSSGDQGRPPPGGRP